jgi:hypothetical protein
MTGIEPMNLSLRHITFKTNLLGMIRIVEPYEYGFVSFHAYDNS